MMPLAGSLAETQSQTQPARLNYLRLGHLAIAPEKVKSLLDKIQGHNR
jgi:hypothetical protein